MKNKIILSLLLILFGLFVGPKSAWATRAALSCTPSSGTYNVGDTIDVEYVLDTRTFQSCGATLVMTYDATMLEPVGTQSTPISSVTNWTAPSVNSVDSTLGKIQLDYGTAQSMYTGSTSIGKISFKAKQSGQAEFKYTFFQQYDDTTPGVAKVCGKKDNVTASNILTDVYSCVYVISGAAAGTAAPTSAATTAPSISQLPRSGSTENTFALIFFALIIMGIGIVVPAVTLKRS